MQLNPSSPALREVRPPTPTSASSSDTQEEANASKASSDSHLERSEGEDAPGGTLLRRSPRFDDTLERIQEDLGMIEIQQTGGRRRRASSPKNTRIARTSRQTEVVIHDERVENQKPLSARDSLSGAALHTPQISQSAAESSGDIQQGWNPAETLRRPRQMLLSCSKSPHDRRSFVTSRKRHVESAMEAGVINSYTAQHPLEITVERGDVLEVFGAIEGFVGVEDPETGRFGWIPQMCCNVWPNKNISEG